MASNESRMNRNLESARSGLFVSLGTACVLAFAGCSSQPQEPDLAATHLGGIESDLSASDSDAVHPKQDFTLFEAAAVRPIVVHTSGMVAVTNTPDDRIELFRPSGNGVTHCGSVNVGMRPVAAAQVGEQLWVVNQLSDSVSVLGLDPQNCSATLERTLLVGDEPRDVVVAKNRTGKQYVFVTAAHRGQNVRSPDGSYRDPQLTTPGIGRADVFVFDPQNLADVGAEQPLEIINLFTDTPRALAVGDGKVYAAGFMSGNQTAVVRYQLVINRGRNSLAQLDTDGDFQIDPGLSPAKRKIEGGYPAVKGRGRCISAQTLTPPEQASNDFIMDVCVQTAPGQPYQAVDIVPQVSGHITPQCSCTNALGELQRTPPLIVRFYESRSACGNNFDVALGGCWLEPPQNDALSGLRQAQQWNQQVPFSLPDRDVFAIDVNLDPPALVRDGDFRKVGTTLFSMAVHPANGKVFVSNTEARNHVRFEGPGAAATTGFANTTVRGHTTESRITLLDPSGRAVKPIHLNAHIKYDACCEEGPNPETERSLAFPVGLAISSKTDRFGRPLSDQDLYVAALGSDKVAVLSTVALERARPGSEVQDVTNHIEVPGGPTGLALDEARGLLYVLARYNNELVVIDTRSRQSLERHAMFSPEPQSVVAGRPFLYDARRTSSHGDSACASCHIFGDFDGLAWDLGAPDDAEAKNYGPFFAKPEITSAPLTSNFLALKGPMTTQSLRGLANHGAMHWRGDRRAAGEVSEQPDTGAFDETAAFTAFNVAFPGLNGRSQALPDEEMRKFTDFALQLTYPPNPIRALDNRLNAAQQRARSRYFGCDITDESMARGECADGRDIAQETLGCNCLNPPRFVLGLEQRPQYCPPDPQCTLEVSDFQNTCNGCHTLDPNGNASFGVDKPGFFGTSGVYTNDAVAHILKIPHLRNAYQKVGMFGSIQTPRGIGLNALPDSIVGARRGGLFAPQNAYTGEQIRGFGFTHAGEEDTVFHFFSLSGFTRAPSPGAAFVNDNSAGFEPVLPHDAARCFDQQLPTMNALFLEQLAPAEQVLELTRLAQTLVDPTAAADAKAQAFQTMAGFVLSLPPDNPGAVFQRLPVESAVGQLTLPLLACGALPGSATLTALGCFELSPGDACTPLLDAVRGCSLWGATLEEILPNGVQACAAAGLSDKADMESLVFAFDSNLKPVVGQQVTLRRGQTGKPKDRLALLLDQATAGNCDVVAHSARHGYVYRGHQFLRDDGQRLTLQQMLRRERLITYTAVPPGEGRRSGVDRDGDGALDGIERRMGTDPGDATDAPH